MVYKDEEELKCKINYTFYFVILENIKFG